MAYRDLKETLDFIENDLRPKTNRSLQDCWGYAGSHVVRISTAPIVKPQVRKLERFLGDRTAVEKGEKLVFEKILAAGSVGTLREHALAIERRALNTAPTNKSHFMAVPLYSLGFRARNFPKLVGLVLPARKARASSLDARKEGLPSDASRSNCARPVQ